MKYSKGDNTIILVSTFSSLHPPEMVNFKTISFSPLISIEGSLLPRDQLKL